MSSASVILRMRSAGKSWRLAALMMLAVVMILALAAPALAIGAISGTVTDEMGDPLMEQGVTLWAWDADYGDYVDVAITSTDEYGSYVFYEDELWMSGPYFVTFEDWWYGQFAPETYDNQAFADWENATPVLTGASGIDAQLAQYAPAISGSVYSDETGDPIEWAWVDAFQYDADWDEWNYVAGTDVMEGYYELTGIEAGETIIGISEADGMMPQFFDGAEYMDFESATPVVYDGETMVTDIDFYLATADPAIGGVVTDQVTGEPIWDAEVSLWKWADYDGAWYESESTYTDETGAYVFDESQVDGEVRIEFDASHSYPSYYREFYNNQTRVDLATSVLYNGTFKGAINAALVPSSDGIRGLVDASDTGLPLEGVDVTAHVYDATWEEWWSEGWDYTKEDGAYSIPDAQLASGTDYLITFDGSWVDYLPETYNDQPGFAPESATLISYTGAAVENINAALDPAPVMISGTVLDEVTNEPAKNVEVLAEYYYEDLDWGEAWWDTEAYATTDENGQYKLTTLDLQWSTDYVISFAGEWAGYQSETYDGVGFQDYDNATLVPVTGDPQVVNADLVPLPTVVEGAVTDAQTDLPLEGASAYLLQYFQEDDWADWGIVDGVSIYADGTYALQGDGEGPFKVMVEASQYKPKTSGQFFYAGSTLTRNFALDPLGTVDRVAGTTRFSGSVVTARAQFDPDENGTWPGVRHIILASGEDRAAADPLAAAGLSGAYDAPLFLVSSSGVSAEVKTAVKQIAAAAAAAGEDVEVHIVGGSTSVPDARFNDIKTYAGANLIKDRILSSGGRFDLSAAIARRIMEVNGAAPEVVLIANGQDAPKFFDALALSPIAAANGYPLLLVQADNIPNATWNVLDDIADELGDTPRVVIGGGSATVSDDVKFELGADRWAGTTRYTTAIAIADNAVDEGWLSRENVGIAAKLPDALTGGAGVGLKGGVLVLTDGAKLTPATATWLTTYKDEIVDCEVFGGAKSVLPIVHTKISEALK